MQITLAKLTLEERKRFEDLIENNLDALVERWTPWWEPLSSCHPPERGCSTTVLQNPPHPDLAYTLLDLIFSYVVALKTMNGDFSATDELCEIIIQTSHVLATTPTNFTYSNICQVIEVCSFQLLSSSFKFNSNSLPIFLLALVDILSSRDYVSSAISHLTLILACGGKMQLSRKVLYFRTLFNSLPDQLLGLFILGIKAEAQNLSSLKEDNGNIFQSTALIQEV